MIVVLMTEMAKRWRMGGECIQLNMLDKGMIDILAGMEQEGVRFCHTI